MKAHFLRLRVCFLLNCLLEMTHYLEERALIRIRISVNVKYKAAHIKRYAFITQRVY